MTRACQGWDELGVIGREARVMVKAFWDLQDCSLFPGMWKSLGQDPESAECHAGRQQYQEAPGHALESLQGPIAEVWRLRYAK